MTVNTKRISKHTISQPSISNKSAGLPAFSQPGSCGLNTSYEASMMQPSFIYRMFPETGEKFL